MTVPITLLTITIVYFIVMAAWLYRESRLEDTDTAFRSHEEGSTS